MEKLAMTQQCVNNTIQKYMEEGIKKFNLYRTDSLYEIYKNIRTTMAEFGMIRATYDVRHFSYEDSTIEGMLTNPKTIACSLLYVWIYENGFSITQKEISEHFKIAQSTIRKGGRILEGYIEDMELELSIYKYERKEI